KLLKINKPTNKTVIIKKMFQIYLPFYKNSFNPSNLSESLYSFSNKNTKDSTKKVIAKKQTTNSRKYLYFPTLQHILYLLDLNFLSSPTKTPEQSFFNKSSTETLKYSDKTKTLSISGELLLFSHL